MYNQSKLSKAFVPQPCTLIALILWQLKFDNKCPYANFHSHSEKHHRKLPSSESPTQNQQGAPNPINFTRTVLECTITFRNRDGRQTSCAKLSQQKHISHFPVSSSNASFNNPSNNLPTAAKCTIFHFATHSAPAYTPASIFEGICKFRNQCNLIVFHLPFPTEIDNDVSWELDSALLSILSLFLDPSPGILNQK